MILTVFNLRIPPLVSVVIRPLLEFQFSPNKYKVCHSVRFSYRYMFLQKLLHHLSSRRGCRLEVNAHSHRKSPLTSALQGTFPLLPVGPTDSVFFFKSQKIMLFSSTQGKEIKRSWVVFRLSRWPWWSHCLLRHKTPHWRHDFSGTHVSLYDLSNQKLHV